jgi:hypothetical protein
MNFKYFFFVTYVSCKIARDSKYILQADIFEYSFDLDSNVMTNFSNSKADTTPTHAVHQYVEHREVIETNANNKFNEETKR